MRFSDGASLLGSDEPSDNQQQRRWYYTNFREAFGRGGSAYGVARLADGRWLVDCHLPDGRKLRLGVWNDWDLAMRVQDYCVERDVMTKMALIELHENANFEPLEKLLEDAVTFGRLPRRRLRLTLEVDVEMRGTDDEIKSYAILHVRGATGVKAARVVHVEGPRLEEPKPKPGQFDETR